MVLLPLPLSPTTATISCGRMARSRSSTACRRAGLNSPPMRKWRARARVSSSGAVGSDSATLVEQATHPRLGGAVERGLDLGTARHHLRAAGAEAAAARQVGEI